MAKSYWKTDSRARRREGFVWPSAGQAVRQLGLILIVGAIWAGMFIGFLRLTGAQVAVSSAPEVSIVVNEVMPTETPSPRPTLSPTALPTSSPSPPEPQVSTSTPGLVATETSRAELLVTATVPVTPTELPSATPTPTLTATPVPVTDTATPADSPAGVSFSGDVFPIFDKRCVKCHGGPKDDGSLRIEEGLKLTTYADVMTGSWNGPVVEPGNAESSYLVEQIITGEMPKKEPRLLPSEVRIISAWVDAGAPDN